MSQSWMSTIHHSDPYKDFPIRDWASDPRGWNEGSPIFEEVIKVLRPTKIIEVGTWKGASALRMAALLKKYELGAEIVCVDTFLGSITHWMNPEHPELGMPMKFGRPTLYDQFIANVIHAGHTDVLVPFPTDSLTAAEFFKAKRMIADVIYIDAGHDYDHALADIQAYWDIVRPGGVIFGDDYKLDWIGVVRAVHDFADSVKAPVNVSFRQKWLIQKSR